MSKFKLKCVPMKWKRISQPFRKGKHGGIDLVAPTGTPVYATQDGTVVSAKYGGWDKSYGNMVAIYHGNGNYTNHAHLSKIKVKVGQKVKAGTLIGLCGSSGNSTGSHLHYEIHLGKKWNRIDPKPYLDAIGKPPKKKSTFVAGEKYTLQVDMNIRAEHSSKSKKVGTLKKGSKVHATSVYKTNNGTYWVRFVYKGKARWVCAKTGKGKVYLK